MVTGDQAAGRECILEQAQQLFLAHGYHGVSIRDIAQACGLSNAALYYHFGSKQNLFVEVLKAHIAVAIRRLQAAGMGGGSCRERLARMAQAHAQFMLESQSELQALGRDLMRFDREEVKRLFPAVKGQIPSQFALVLEEGIAAGEVRPLDPQRTGFLLLGMVNALTSQRRAGPVVRPLEEEIDLAIDTLFEGIGTRT